MQSSYGATGGGGVFTDDDNCDGDLDVETRGLLSEEDSNDTPPEATHLLGPPSQSALRCTRRRSRISPVRKGCKGCKSHQLFWLMWLLMVCLAILVGVPALVLRFYRAESEIRVYLVLIATLSVVLAVPISLYSIRRHLLNFWVPPLQVYMVRILWMVPVYSVCTLASLYLWVCGKERGVYIANCLRQCFEAYTLYNLFGFMITFLEMEHGIPAGKVLALRYKGTSHVTHVPPFSIPLGSGILAWCLGNVDDDSDPPSSSPSAWPSAVPDEEEFSNDNHLSSGDNRGGESVMTTLLSKKKKNNNDQRVPLVRWGERRRRLELIAPWPMGEDFVHRARRGVLFYVATMPLLASLIAVLSLLGIYHEGNFSLYSVNFWTSSFAFAASCWALYCLALFFVVARHDLEPIKPLAKVLLVKGIVFFTWAQSIAISAAFYVVYDYKARRMTAAAAKAALVGGEEHSDIVARAEAAQALEDERIMFAGAVCDAVICVEMLGFAVGHAVAFDAQQFERVAVTNSKLTITSREGFSTSNRSLDVEPTLFSHREHKFKSTCNINRKPEPRNKGTGLIPKTNHEVSTHQVALSSGTLGNVNCATNRKVAERDKKGPTTGRTSMEEVEVADDKNREDFETEVSASFKKKKKIKKKKRQTTDRK